MKVAAMVLIAAGVLALAYGGFTYTRNTETATLGPIEISVQEKERVNIPIWAGVAGVVVGSVLLLAAAKRR